MTETDTRQTGTPLQHTLDVGAARVAARTAQPARPGQPGRPGAPGDAVRADPERPAAPPAATTGRPDRSRAPATGDQLYQRADAGARWADYASHWHDSRAGRWALIDTWARLLVAVAASLSALSLVTANAAVTAVLAVLTAVASALNAALEPAERAARNRRAAADYRPLARDLGALAWETMGRIWGREETIQDERGYQPRWVDPPGLSADQLAAMSSDLQDLEARLDAVMDGAPPMNRLKSPDSAPRTRWGVRRLARRLSRQQQVLRLQGDVEAMISVDELAVLHRLPDVLPRTRCGLRRLEKRVARQAEIRERIEAAARARLEVPEVDDDGVGGEVGPTGAG